jgi:hypothetical protein
MTTMMGAGMMRLIDDARTFSGRTSLCIYVLSTHPQYVFLCSSHQHLPTATHLLSSFVSYFIKTFSGLLVYVHTYQQRPTSTRTRQHQHPTLRTNPTALLYDTSPHISYCQTLSSSLSGFSIYLRSLTPTAIFQLTKRHHHNGSRRLQLNLRLFSSITSEFQHHLKEQALTEDSTHSQRDI